MTSQYETNLWSTHDNTVRQAEPISRCFAGERRFSKSRGLSASVSFLPLPLPPLSFFGSHFISRAAKTGLSLLRNQMETLSSTQAISFTFFLLSLIFTSHWWPLAFLILSPRPQNFHVTLPTKKCLFCFLSLALDLCRPFSRWASLAAAYFHFFSVLLLLYIPNLWTMNRRLIL